MRGWHGRGPAPGKVLTARDVCPDTDLSRLSYGQALPLLDQPAALTGPGTGWEPQHQQRSLEQKFLERGGGDQLDQ